MSLVLPSERRKKPAGQEAALIRVRMVQPHEGPLIHELLQLGDWSEIPDLDWTANPTPFWLIAECAGIPMGTICINPGRPIGTMEFLAVDKTAPKRVRAIAVKKLCYGGLETLRTMGTQIVSSTLIERDQEWAKVIQRRGSVAWTKATIYLRRS